VCDDKQSLAAGKKARLCGEFVRVKRANIKFLKLLTAAKRSIGLMQWTVICQNVFENPSLA
jgi:hypothetical protein